ncbi:MAG: metalloenzyme [bacterium]|nr:metalloenzyme [bacterium]
MHHQPRILLIFIDGLGVGLDDPQRNPLARHPDLWPVQGRSPRRPGLYYSALDACLGVEGLPQSATGQTALLTGINAPKLLGYHLQGFPSKRLIEILQQHSIFVQLQRCGAAATFANAYRQPEDILPTSRLSVTSHALRACGQPFRSVHQIERGEALYHDFTNRQLIARGFDVPIFTPQRAAESLINVARVHRFTLYEHFLTDILGHRGDEAAIIEHIDCLSDFIRTVLNGAEREGLTVVITSDHGNIEDGAVRTHTRNRVPLLYTQPSGSQIEDLPETITEVTCWILKQLDCVCLNETIPEILSV